MHAELLEYINKIRNGGIKQSADYGTTHVDRVMIELLFENYEISEKLKSSIDKFDKSSTKLSKAMIWLTAAILVLTTVMVIKMFI